MQLLYIDTETSGIGPDDRLCQLACKTGTKVINELFKPPVSIKPEASAVTHITDKHVADKPSFFNSDTYLELKTLADTSIFVAHNAAFDLKLLEKEGITFKHHICTLKIARHLDDNGMSNHQLQYLRYYYGLDIDLGGLSPHDALADIIVLEEVFKVLGRKLMEKEQYQTRSQRSSVCWISPVSLPYLSTHHLVSTVSLVPLLLLSRTSQ